MPRNVLAEKSTATRVAQDVRSKLVEEEFRNAMGEHEFQLLSNPQIDPEQLQPGEDGTISLEVKLEMVPKFELGTYKGAHSFRSGCRSLRGANRPRAGENFRQQQSQVEPVEGPRCRR